MFDAVIAGFLRPEFETVLVDNNLFSWKTKLFFSLLRIALKICPGALGQRKSAPSGLAGKI